MQFERSCVDGAYVGFVVTGIQSVPGRSRDRRNIIKCQHTQTGCYYRRRNRGSFKCFHGGFSIANETFGFEYMMFLKLREVYRCGAVGHAFIVPSPAR